jgi:RND family efflux transporter MFP subunit
MYWSAAGVLLACLVTGIILYVTQILPGPQPAQAREAPPAYDEESSPPPPILLAVDVIRPQKGMDYEVEQPGSVHAFESVQLHAKVAGFLKKQNVDIGDRVKKDQVLAVIAVPELDKQLQRNRASLEQARAHVKQMEARVLSARADQKAAEAAVEQADAAYESAKAWVRFRSKQHQRIKDLFDSQSIAERLVDESKERYEASLETERAAKAAIATTSANVVAAAARIKQAEADVAGAESEVKVAQAELEKTQVMLDYATIIAPFDGEICHRNFFPGDFIRSAAEGSSQPLLTIQRTDKLRVVVQVPDTAVPFLDKGDPATVRIDSLPGRKFPAKVSRKAGSEDPNTRLMHVEVDLPNPTGEIGDGMYGKVRILLDRFPNLLSVPSSCLVRTPQGQPAVYVVEGEQIRLRQVRICKDNGQRVCVTSGLSAGDLVVLTPTAGIASGVEAQAHVVEETQSPRGEDEPG